MKKNTSSGSSSGSKGNGSGGSKGGKTAKKIIEKDGLKAELYFNGGYLGVFGEVVENAYQTLKPKIEELIPRAYEKKREERDKTKNHHLTLMLKRDIKQVIEKLPSAYPALVKQGETPTIQTIIDALAHEVFLSDFKVLGIGKQTKSENETVFIVIEWPSANQFLENVGLERKDFHITIGFKSEDIHGVAKNQNTLIHTLE
ncbi:hypothetical protein ABK040_006784 [Willaertia magna]